MSTSPERPEVGRTLTRELTAQVHTRAAAGTDEITGREFSGLAVPFDTPIDYAGIREQFAPDSIEPADRVLVCWRHDEPIGRVTAHRATDAGWEVDGMLSDTATARDAATLLRDGVIDRLSVAFEPLEWREDRDDAGVPTFTYTRARVTEVSLVPFPAYATAQLSAVRSAAPSTPQTPSTDQKEPPMPETTAPDHAELRSAIDELTRKVELIGTTGEPRAAANPLAQFRSFGEFVKRTVAGDETALRAYEGLVLGDIMPDDATVGTFPAWATQAVKIIEANTPTAAFFNHTKDLPPTGMTVEHGTVTLDNGLRVAEQLAEGDDLVFGKLGLKLAPRSARVYTIGGWTDMSRQVIERSPINVVDLMWRGFAIKYAEALEAIAAKVMTDTYAQQLAAGGAAVVHGDLATANGVIDLLVDLATRYQTTTYKLDALFVAPDVFKALAKIDQQPKALQITQAPLDKLGTLNMTSLQANLANIQVKLWPGAPAGAAFAADSQALKIQEAPGAPFRLQDDNIVNLTKQFSVYGYATAYAEMPDGIVPITAAGAAPVAI